MYNWGAGGGYIAGDSEGQSYTNIIGNAFISGPSTSARPFTRGNANFHTFVSNNYYDPDQVGFPSYQQRCPRADFDSNFQDGKLSGFILGQSTDNYSPVDFQATKYNYPTVATVLSPTDAVAHVIATAGASKSRDHVDDYLINTELKSYGKTGAIISDPTASPINGPGPISGGTVRVTGTYCWGFRTHIALGTD